MKKIIATSIIPISILFSGCATSELKHPEPYRVSTSSFILSEDEQKQVLNKSLWEIRETAEYAGRLGVNNPTEDNCIEWWGFRSKNLYKSCYRIQDGHIELQEELKCYEREYDKKTKKETFTELTGCSYDDANYVDRYVKVVNRASNLITAQYNKNLKAAEEVKIAKAKVEEERIAKAKAAEEVKIAKAKVEEERIAKAKAAEEVKIAKAKAADGYLQLSGLTTKSVSYDEFGKKTEKEVCAAQEAFKQNKIKNKDELINLYAELFAKRAVRGLSSVEGEYSRVIFNATVPTLMKAYQQRGIVPGHLTLNTLDVQTKNGKVKIDNDIYKLAYVVNKYLGIFEGSIVTTENRLMLLESFFISNDLALVPLEDIQSMDRCGVEIQDISVASAVQLIKLIEQKNIKALELYKKMSTSAPSDITKYLKDDASTNKVYTKMLKFYEGFK